MFLHTIENKFCEPNRRTRSASAGAGRWTTSTACRRPGEIFKYKNYITVTFVGVPRVVYSDCTGVDGEGGYGMKIVPRSRGNGASFLVQPNRCYEVSVTLVGTDGSYTASSAVTIQVTLERNKRYFSIASNIQYALISNVDPSIPFLK